jgi:hypothetical protein
VRGSSRGRDFGIVRSISSRSVLRGLAAALAFAAIEVATAATPALGAFPFTYPLLSTPANGALAGYAITGDQRDAHLVAFSSDATNVVRGVASGHFSIFVIHRAAPFNDAGQPWVPGGVSAPVRGLGGAAPNGDAILPSVGGDFYNNGDCVAFISTATNLVRGVSSGRPEAYLENLRSRRVMIVSVSSHGAPANGPVDSVSVDGQCARVAFTSTATNLTSGAPREVRSAAAPGGIDEVYVHIFSARGFPAGVASGFPALAENRGRVGKTFLVSANAAGHPADGNCSHAVIASFGLNVAYSCDSSNLAAHTGGESNVYTTQLSRGFGSAHARPIGVLRRATSLVSETPSRRAGNGPSDHPAINADGSIVVYHTTSSNLGAPTAVGSVIRADVTRSPAAQLWVSRPFDGLTLPNGPSDDPSIDFDGGLLMFDSSASNIGEPGPSNVDNNNASDIFLWGANDRLVKLRSLPCDAECHPLSGASSHPVTSWVINYTLFTHDGQLWMRFIGK